MTKSIPVVHVVDDDPSILKSLKRLLTAHGYNVEIFSSASEFFAHKTSRFGCAVLDISLPDVDGLNLQEEFINNKIFLPIIFITGHGDIPMSVKAMKRGAIDFLAKPFDAKDLLDAIERAIQINMDEQAQKVKKARFQTSLKRLTSREYEVFLQVIKGMLNKQIAIKLGTVEKTIKVHRSRVMQKMQAKSVANLVHLSDQHGTQIEE